MRKCSRAFTLIELTVVILIISLSLTIALPKFALGSDPRFLLKANVNKITSILEYAYQQAACRQLTYLFNIDLVEGTYWISNQNKDGREVKVKEKFKLDGNLPEGVKFLNVKLFGENVINKNTITVRLNPDGYADPAEIVLTCSTGETMSIRINEFSGQIETQTIEGIN